MVSTSLEIPRTDIPEMDTVHSEMMRIAGELLYADQPGQERDIMERLLKKAILHSISEEQLLDVYACPGSREQKELHKEFLMDLSLFTFPTGGFLFRKKELIHFIYKWLVDHIHGFDRSLAEYMRLISPEVQ